MIDRRKIKGTILNRADYDYSGHNPLRVEPYEYSYKPMCATEIIHHEDEQITANQLKERAREGLAKLGNLRTYAQFILQSRRQLGLSQAKFGKLLGVQSNTVSFWERGIRNPTETVIILIQRLLEDQPVENNPI